MMTDAIKNADRNYSAFAASMLAAEASEAAWAAKVSSNPRTVRALQASAVATVRPCK